MPNAYWVFLKCFTLVIENMCRIGVKPNARGHGRQSHRNGKSGAQQQCPMQETEARVRHPDGGSQARPRLGRLSPRRRGNVYPHGEVSAIQEGREAGCPKGGSLLSWIGGGGRSVDPQKTRHTHKKKHKKTQFTSKILQPGVHFLQERARKKTDLCRGTFHVWHQNIFFLIRKIKD